LELYSQPGTLYPLHLLGCQVCRSLSGGNHCLTRFSAWCSGIPRGERCIDIRPCNSVSIISLLMRRPSISSLEHIRRKLSAPERGPLMSDLSVAGQY
jgi:hypothetical protein